MRLYRTGLSQRAAGLAWQERCAVQQTQVPACLARATAAPGVAGAVLLATCGRTELYLEAAEDFDAAALLRGLLGQPDAPLTTQTDGVAARSLLRVACGLDSPIPGDDQIGGQVRAAMECARAAGALTANLSALFQAAVTAAKRCKTVCKLGVPRSAAAAAVRQAQAELGELTGRRAVVIGGGEMGRLAARLLRAAGAQVTVTLRTYRHGETVVPAGCTALPFDRRAAAIEGADLLLSATRSPHATWTCAQQAALQNPPKLLFDLALPRDLEPGLAESARLYDLQSLRLEPVDLSAAEAVVEEQLAQLRGWYNYRRSLPELAGLEEAIVQRLLPVLPDDPADAAQLAVHKTVELLAAAFKNELSPARIADCTARVRSRTR